MRLLSLFVAACLVSAQVFATPGRQQAVVVNPESLRTLLLSRNIDIALALNEVQQAKAQVSQARSNLLPSVNLGGVISGGTSFMLNAVSFLLPFLMPSKWMDLRESTHLLKAQGTSYYLAQLNGYASAYSVYLTVVGDLQLREALYRQYENYKNIEDQLRLPAEVGIIPMEDYLRAKAQTQMALVQVSQVDELLKREKASVRQMLGLDLDQEIVFEAAQMAASDAESMTPESLLNAVHESSPETAQMNSLIAAAQASRWSKTFSFMTGSSLGANRPSAGGAFGSLTQSGSVNLGFGIFPALEMSNLNIEQLKLRKKELRLDQAQLIETTLGSLIEAQTQYTAALTAEENLRKVYEAEYKRYRVGIADILHVLDAANGLTNAMVNKVKAQTNLNTLRVSLHRLMVSDQFKFIEKCEIERRSSGGLRGKLGRIFNPDKDKATLDQICGN